MEFYPVPSINSNHKTNDKVRLSTGSEKSVLTNQVAHIDDLGYKHNNINVISQFNTLGNADINELKNVGSPCSTHISYGT